VESLTHCEECGVGIPEARRKAIVGVRLCVVCQQELDQQQASAAVCRNAPFLHCV